MKESESAARPAILHRHQERARTSIISLIDAFMGNAAKELVEDALDMIEAAAGQRPK